MESTHEPKKRKNEAIRRFVRVKFHTWTPEEDAALVRCLHTLAEDLKWKADNGTFRPGYLVQLEKMLEKELPKSNIKAEPHIESRIRLLKRHYHAITEMITTGSGFGWNDVDKYVTAPKQVFEDWVRSHPTAKGLRNKLFPYYDDFVIIFGRDRATGEGAESAADAIEKEEKEADSEEFNVSTRFDGQLKEDDTEVNGGGHDESAKAENDAEFDVSASYMDISTRKTQASSKKKAKSVDGTQQLLHHLINFQSAYQEVTSEMKGIAAFFNKEVEANERRLALFEELKKVEGFSREELLLVGQFMIKDNYKVDYFFSLPRDFKKDYVTMLLHECNPYRPAFGYFPSPPRE